MFLDMSADQQHIKHLILYEFRKGIRASQTIKNINKMYPNGLSERTCYRCLEKF